MSEVTLHRFRAKKEHLEGSMDFYLKVKALTVLCVPSLLDHGPWTLNPNPVHDVTVRPCCETRSPKPEPFTGVPRS